MHRMSPILNTFCYVVKFTPKYIIVGMNPVVHVKGLGHSCLQYELFDDA